MFKRRSIRWIALIASVIVLCTVSFFLGGAAADDGNGDDTPVKLDWEMRGYLVRKDGTILDTVSLSLAGEVMETAEGGTMLNYALNLPDTLRYRHLSTDGYVHDPGFDGIIDVPYAVWFGFGYDAEINDNVFMYNAISVEEEMIICAFHYAEEWALENVYLVAATNAEATPEEIMEYFQVLVEKIVA